VSDVVTISERVNNLLNEDFTTYRYAFVETGNGTFWLRTQED
jgi:outer membrane receptor for ferrienterochelin and colicins